MPTDQFSFAERDGHLSVLVRARSAGDAMWGAEVARGDVALARLPLALFTDGVTTAGPERFTPLPRPSGRYGFRNRFVGGHVLYGIGSGWGPARQRARGRGEPHRRRDLL